MTNHRRAGSVESVLTEVMQTLAPVAIHEATGKKIAAFAKVANPMERAGLHLDDAAALDAALISRGERPRFAALLCDLTQAALRRLGGARANAFCIEAGLRRLTAELGDAARAIDDMMADGKSDLHERRKVAKELQDIIDRATEMREHVEPPAGALRAVGE